MTTLNHNNTPTASGVPAYARHPQRISATINWSLYLKLQDRADLEGRSLSNLTAYLLEIACN